MKKKEELQRDERFFFGVWFGCESLDLHTIDFGEMASAVHTALVSNCFRAENELSCDE